MLGAASIARINGIQRQLGNLVVHVIGYDGMFQTLHDISC